MSVKSPLTPEIDLSSSARVALGRAPSAGALEGREAVVLSGATAAAVTPGTLALRNLAARLASLDALPFSSLAAGGAGASSSEESLGISNLKIGEKHVVAAVGVFNRSEAVKGLPPPSRALTRHRSYFMAESRAVKLKVATSSVAATAPAVAETTGREMQITALLTHEVEFTARPTIECPAS